MATEHQIQANRANAAKSTGPITPEGKRVSSQNAARHELFSSTVVLKGESMRRFNDLASALTLQFQPRNSAEAFLVQTMIAARWRLLRMWGIQTAGFESEMARTSRQSGPSAYSGAVLAAVAFSSLADNSKVLALQLRLEAAYDGQYNRALALLLKLREAPDSSRPLLHTDIDPPLQFATETWDDDSQGEPNFDSDPGKDPSCNEQVPDITPNTPHLVANPIPPNEHLTDPLARGEWTVLGALTEPADARTMRCGSPRPCGTSRLRSGTCALRRDGCSRNGQRRDSSRSPPALRRPIGRSACPTRYVLPSVNMGGWMKERILDL